MASFQAKTGWKGLKKWENKKLSFRFVPTWGIRHNSKKIVKKFKKLRNPVMTSFQTKISFKSLSKRENKNYRFVSFLPRRVIENSEKIAKKF